MIRRLTISAALVAATAPAACSSTKGSDDTASSGTASAYPVTVESCGKQVTFDKAPTRAVTSDINMFEDMAALGLEPKMIGTFALKGYGTDGTSNVPERDEAAYQRVKPISADYLALEPLVGAKPDFLFAGWNYGLKVGSTLTPDNLAKYGIKTYVLKESCAHVQNSKRQVTINDTYTDLTNLGKIFGVQAKAASVIASMKKQVAVVQTKIKGADAKSVFLYDSGTDAPFTSPGLAMPNALMSLGGGANVMSSLKQTWSSVSWEQVVKTDPQCIIVNEYGTPTYAEKVKFLETSPITKNLPAVKSKCFIGLDYAQLTPGPNNAAAVETIAKALHPGKF